MVQAHSQLALNSLPTGLSGSPFVVESVKQLPKLTQITNLMWSVFLCILNFFTLTQPKALVTREKYQPWWRSPLVQKEYLLTPEGTYIVDF